MSVSINRVKYFFTINKQYVVVNIYASSIGFARSFVFMKSLDFYDLGIITIIQTVSMLIGLFQIGILNGSYRYFSFRNQENEQKVTNLFFSFILVLAIALFLLYFPLKNHFFDVQPKYILFAFFFGIINLISNWSSNYLVAKHKLFFLNKIIIISYSLSIISFPLVFIWGVNGALTALFVQPLFFVISVLISIQSIRPSKLLFDKSIFILLMRYGFIPFLSGIFVMINNQIERWGITIILGAESLGKFYLVFLFSSLFSLIPNSLNSVFFPKCIKQYETLNFYDLRRTIRKYYKILLIYITISLFLIVVFLKPIISTFLVKHIGSVIYVYWILPSMFFLILKDPIGVLLNVSLKLKPIFWSHAISVFLNLLLLYILYFINEYSLLGVSIIRSIIGLQILSIYILGYIIYYKKIWKRI